MVWNAVGTPIKLDIDWQYTEPVEGIFFRFKHETPPLNAIYEIAQVEANDDGTYTLLESQVLTVERSFTDTIKLAKPEIFTQRRLAIRRVPARPTFEQEIRRLLLPGYLRPNDNSPIALTRNRWQVQIESSDYVESVATVDFAPIQTKLDEISAKIDVLQSTSGGTGSGTPTSISDTFTDTDNKLLADHKMDSGTGWRDPNTKWFIQGNTAKSNGAGVPTGVIAFTEFAKFDCVVSADIYIYTFSVSSQQGLVFRLVDANNWYALRYIIEGDLAIIECKDGVLSDKVKSSSFRGRRDEWHKFKVRMQGDLMIGFIDDVEHIRYTSALFNKATKHGMWNYEYYGSSPASWDNFSIVSL
jgi:hypothetical protein